jgi:hypothetical protein
MKILVWYILIKKRFNKEGVETAGQRRKKVSLAPPKARRTTNVQHAQIILFQYVKPPVN